MKRAKTLACALMIATAADGQASAAIGPALPEQACKGTRGYASSFGGRRTFLLKPNELTSIKSAVRTEPVERAAYDELIRRADAALVRRHASVMDKTSLPPSGDRHDYMSLAPYWWPDPANPAGSYVRRDGEVNPQRATKAFDHAAISRMSDDVTSLSLAYYYSDDARYAAKAAELIRTWFLDAATSMNPNARFAQAVPGQADGRPEGILDTSDFQTVIEAVGLIAPSRALKADEERRLERWFSDYVDWLLTSPMGKEESGAKNNHGIWFDSQITHYALFARRFEIARAVVRAFADKRIATQFDPSGRLPAELTRTRSFHYSIFALIPSYNVADLARCVDYDLWNYRAGDGRGLRAATDFLASYRNRTRTWPFKEIRWDLGELDALLTRADSAWGRGTYPHATPGYPVDLEYRGTGADHLEAGSTNP